MAFTEEELELLNKAAYVPTPRKILGMDQKTDVIFYEPTTDEATHEETASYSKANSL